MVPYVLRLAVALLLPTLATGDAAEGVPAGGAKSPSAWTGAEVGEWLFEQGLGPYRDAFAAHGIDGHHLLALRDHAMKETFNMEGCASQPHPRTGGGVGRVLSGAYQSCVPQLTAPRYEKPPQGCARVFWTHLRISGTHMEYHTFAVLLWLIWLESSGMCGRYGATVFSNVETYGRGMEGSDAHGKVLASEQ